MKQYYKFIFIPIFIYLIFVFFNINSPPWDLHQFRQTQTLSTILNYIEKDIDLFHPELDTNGPNSVVILELPLYQAIVALFSKYFGFSMALARVVNILIIILGIFLLAKIFYRHYGLTFSLAFTMTCLLNPSFIFWTRTPLIDPFALGLSFISFYFLYNYFIANNRFFNFLLGYSFATAALLVKPTVAFIPLGAFGVWSLTILIQSKQWNKIILLVLNYLLCVTIIYFWKSHSSYWHSVNPHLYTSNNFDWYFGKSSQFFDSGIMNEFFRRVLYNHNGFLLIGLFPFYLFVIIKRKEVLLLSSFVLTLVYLNLFVNLNFIHTYYQLPIVFGIALLLASSIDIIEKELSRHIPISSNYHLKKIGFLIFITALSMQSFIFLDNYWVDIQPTKSPYKISQTEYECAKQVNPILEEYQLDRKNIVIQYNMPNHTGPHSLLYYLKGQGYITTKTMDPTLASSMKAFLYFGNDLNFHLKKNNWKLLNQTALKGSCIGYFFKLFIQENKNVEPTWKPEKSQALEVIGEKGQLYTTPHIFYNLPVSKFSYIKVTFDSYSQFNLSQDAYLILRTYEGGYGEDQQVYLNIKEKQIHSHEYYFYIKGYSDYSIHFGEMGEGHYTIKNLQIESGINLNKKFLIH